MTIRVLHGEGFTLRESGKGEHDQRLLVLQDPTVERWWGKYDLAKLTEDDEDSETVRFLIEVDGATAGIIQYSEETDPQYRHAGIDIAIREPFQRQQLGPRAIRLLARYLIDELGHHRLVIDPATENQNAIRAYESVGFRPVGIMRQYERGLDGTFHDGLLMDLLSEEFVR